MEEAAATRQAALDAVSDVEPVGLQQRIQNQINAGSMVPGALTLLCARATTSGHCHSSSSSSPTSASETDGQGIADHLGERTAGVQLIYEGLRLTRQLARDEPWDHDEAETADLAILVADVLVARGFYLLARTEAAEQAVQTVRGFGRDQTVRADTGDPTLDQNLEADVLELAVVAGASFGESSVPASLREFTSELAAELDRNSRRESFPGVEQFFTNIDVDRLNRLATDGVSEGVTSVDD